MSTARGYLIVLEGVDGVGKTTQSNALAAHLRAQGRTVVQSREPTTGPYGAMIRQAQKTHRLSPEEELQLFLDDRREHIATLIQPALDRGEIVILDRYYFSTIAYQGARGFDPAELRTRNEAFAPPPDALFILDLDPTHGLERIERLRGDALDAFEVPELLIRSRAIFLQLAEALPYAHVVDARRSPEEVTQDIVAVLDRVVAA